MILFAFFCIISVVLLVVAIYISFFKDEDLGFTLLLIDVFFFMVVAISAACWGYKEGEIQGLLYSGKYEIVSNEDYSLNELKSFIKINDYYLKEIDDEQ